MSDVQSGSVSLLLGWTRAGGRHGYRGDAAAHERRLLVRVEGKREAHQLLEPARPRRFAATSLGQSGSQGLDEPRGGRARGVGVKDECRPAVTAEPVAVGAAADLPASLLSCEGC